MILNEATQEYLKAHADDDVRSLALQGTKDEDIDLPMALQQIAGHQTARRKLPSWAPVEGIVYPPHLNMEQCSSEQTARYKQRLVERLTAGKHGTGSSDTACNGAFADLTGGFGVDFYFMSQGFKERIYVEQNANLCDIAKHNFSLLDLPCSIHNCDTLSFLTAMEGQVDIIYLDPARRNEHGGRTYGIEDCSPNVLELLSLLMKKALFTIIKLSPMLDWRKAVSDLKHVREVHIVSVDNECKELLLVLGRGESKCPTVTCVNNESIFRFTPKPKVHSRQEPLHDASYLYEPNSSIMKAGCFAEMEQQYAARQLSANSHLFVSAVEIADFPGRRFQISAISSMNKQALKVSLKGIERSNISVRNFPLTTEQLRKKLKLKDGGDVFIFATTDPHGDHKLFICRKIG